MLAVRYGSNLQKDVTWGGGGSNCIEGILVILRHFKEVPKLED